MSENKEVVQDSLKKDSEKSVRVRTAQSRAGKVFLSERKLYTIEKDSKHLKKGQKVNICSPTSELFKELGLIK